MNIQSAVFLSECKKVLVGASVLIVAGMTSLHASAAPGDTVYKELLSNCSSEIYKQGYSDVTLKLARKVKNAGGYRFWIDIIENESKNKTTAYCEGKTREGSVEKFEILASK